jgi:hypothetical protein
VDGRTTAMREVYLEPGAATVVNFALNEKAGGEHVVEVGGLQAGFFIPPAEFVLSNLTVMPERIKEGQPVTIEVQVTNQGGCSGTYFAELKSRGTTEMAQQVTLAPGVTQTVSFLTTKKKAGFYPVEIGDLTGKISVLMNDYFEEI